MPLIRRTRPAPGAAPAADAAGVDALALTSGSDEERWAAARAAAGVPGAAQSLAAAAARERNPRVREAMFTSLAQISTAESVEALVPLLRSDDSALRTGALDALRASKVAVQSYVARLIHDDDSDVRLLACELVRALPEDVACGLLCHLLEEESEANVCAAAIEVLSEVGNATALPALAHCEARFRAVPFLAFAIKTTADRIRSNSSIQRG